MTNSLESAIGSYRLTPENTTITTRGDMPSIVHTNDDGEKTTYDKIVAVRNFPFEYKEQYITLLDEQSQEIGIIIDINDFSEAERAIIRAELDRRYYMPVILSFESIKEKIGFAKCEVLTENGRMTFSVKDIFRSIFRFGKDSAIITDVDGNRYEIPEISKLDKKSLKMLELII